jgi:hypothetical protein
VREAAPSPGGPAHTRSAESASFQRFGGSAGGQLLGDEYMLKAGSQGPAVSSGKSGVFDAVRADGTGGERVPSQKTCVGGRSLR